MVLLCNCSPTTAPTENSGGSGTNVDTLSIAIGVVVGVIFLGILAALAYSSSICAWIGARSSSPFAQYSSLQSGGRGTDRMHLRSAMHDDDDPYVI